MKRRPNLQSFCAVMLIASIAPCAPAMAQTQSAPARVAEVTPAQAKAIAEEGYVYGLPLVMNYAVMYDFVIDKTSSQFKAPFNQIKNEHRVFTWEDTTVIVANSDTPYSNAWLDLRAEPIVLSVPAVSKDRYYSVQLIDGNTFNYGYIGSRATGSDAGDYLVVGPGWKGKTPPGIKKVFHSDTAFSLLIYRTQLFNPDDMPNVIKVQSGYKVQTLSSYLGQPAPAAAPVIDFPKIDKELSQTHFFDFLAFALQFAPPGPEEQDVRAKLARIGVVAGKPFNLAALSPELRGAIVEGLKAGQQRVVTETKNLGTGVNGWRLSSKSGDRAFYHGNWLLRAAAAQSGIYGNDAEEAAYPLTFNLANGEALDGSQHNYTLTFPAGQLPPVNSFWSVTMYDGKSLLLIKNPIDRYLINSTMLSEMKKNADGSLTLYIQNDSPGKALESNWLPAPDGPIYLVMRLYWPKTEAPSILPLGKGSWQPPAIQKVK